MAVIPTNTITPPAHEIPVRWGVVYLYLPYLPTRKLRIMAYQKINLNTLPIGTVIDVMHIDDTGSYIVTLGKKLDKKWHRHGDGAVIDADQIRVWATRITIVRTPA